MNVKIYGAGLSGLITAHVLRDYSPVIYEQQNSLPNNHHALLRFRTDKVAKATGIDFQKVRVHKSVYKSTGCHIRDNNNYSMKTRNVVQDTSILNLDSCDRWIAPPDFVSRLAAGCKIEYGVSLQKHVFHIRDNSIHISTVPMHKLMGYCAVYEQYEIPVKFSYQSIFSFSSDIVKPNTNIYQTVYVPNDTEFSCSLYRASITGSHFVTEHNGERFVSTSRLALNRGFDEHIEALRSLFLPSRAVDVVNFVGKAQEPGKIVPIDEHERKRFIVYMSDKYNLYSIGRYATWRQILLDDIIKDAEIIKTFIHDRYGYQRKRSSAKWK